MEPGTKDPHDYWVEGSQVNGHPNICPLLDFFEDDNYYYLVMPCITPVDMEPTPPSDLFELVESYPDGLPPHMIRSYLGQIADALYFLHSQGIGSSLFHSLPGPPAERVVESSPPRHQGRERDSRTRQSVPAHRLWKFRVGQKEGLGYIQWNVSRLLLIVHCFTRISDTEPISLNYASPEILRGERYAGKEQDVWAFGVVAYVMIVGECPFSDAAEIQKGLDSPFSDASVALGGRCAGDKEQEGAEKDGGGALGDAAALVRTCLALDVAARPTFEEILVSRFLRGIGGR